MGSRPGELARTTSPVRRRSLNTVPGGALSPIFSAICSLPERRKLAARPVAKTELGRGDRIDGHQVSAIEKG